MPKPVSFGHIAAELTTGTASAGGTVQKETPLCLGILGDFSGRDNRSVPSTTRKLADRKPILVDRDNLNEVLAKFGVALHLPTGGKDSPRVSLHFAELDDFHPDRLFQRIEAFRELSALRAKLNHPTTFAAAAAEIQRLASTGTPPESAPPPQPSPPQTHVDPKALLDQMLGEPRAKPQPGIQIPGIGDMQAFINRLVEPYSTPATDRARQTELLAQVDDAMGRQLCAFLHHPDFQAIEAAWRAVDFLLHRLDTDAHLKLYLLDVSKAELAADLNAAEDLRSTGAYRLLVEETAGTLRGQPWGLLVGLWTFGAKREDVELLGRMAKIARSAGAPFLAAASARVLGCESVAGTPDPDDWQQPLDRDDMEAYSTLRRLPEASYVGLALPRFLLRLPYGKNTSPTEEWNFEEMPEGSSHEAYLWGNPAIACAYLIAAAYQQSGWDFRPGEVQEFAGLPVHVYRADGESQVKPSAEVVLTQRAVEKIVAAGLIPLLSIRGRDAVRIPWLGSLAQAATPLSGRWKG